MITRLLVANRGEIARRIFTTARAMGIGTVAVYSDADARAPHVAEADLAVRLAGSAPADTYLRADLLVDAARRSGADAVHPGYGFLSENADFARAVGDAGLVWVGPSPEAIAAMGSKLRAKELVAAAGVPVLPSLAPEDLPGSNGVAFPLLVKASAGGGGRGMRVVSDRDGLAEAVASARREAEAAFGDGTVFCEPWLRPCRHVEVQVVADTHGRVVALGERECSVQRRHQKIIEETPSPAVDPDLRQRLCQAAVAAAGAVGYTGAGTVEFLLTEGGEFFFLEMNTRLQVEHPVTECVTGLDLVRVQIEVAEGQPLSFEETPVVRGHAIEARVYAEDPAADWRPCAGELSTVDVPGVVARFAPPADHGVRLDFGVVDGSVVGVHYDAMLGKVIAWAPNRPAAARMLAGALAGARLHGVTTNRDLLVRVLRHPAFLAGATDTGFLTDHPEVVEPLLDPDGVRLAALAAALAGMAERRTGARVLGGLPSGWRNNPSAPQSVTFDGPAGPVTVTYRLRGDEVTDLGPEFAGLGGVRLVSVGPSRVVLEIDGVRQAFRVARVGGRSCVDGAAGSVELVEVPRFVEPAERLAAGSLVAPMPGAVLRVAVAEGDRVSAGQVLFTLEAMKMEHPVRAPGAGTVTAVCVAAGSQVDAGAVLAVVGEL